MFISILLITAFLLIAFWILFSQNRIKANIARGVSMVSFLVRFPQGPDLPSAGDFQNLISSFSGVHAAGWNRLLYGEPYIGLELVVDGSNEESSFYIIVPKNYDNFVQRKIKEFWPDARLEKVANQNIFHIHGRGAGSYIITKDNSKFTPELFFKCLDKVKATLSKLHEDEGAVCQILVRHLHSFRNNSAGNFEANIRILAWADSEIGASSILNEVKTAEPLKMIEAKNKQLDRLIFNSLSLIFDDKQSIHFSV